MSGLGKEEDFKALIEGMFKEKKEARAEEKKTEEKVVRHRVRIPEPPAQTKEEQAVALKYAKEEMETIRQALLDFQDKASETVIFDFLLGELEEFVEACQDMETLLTDDFNKEEITEHGLTDYEKMRKIRARILNDVYKKYNQGK